MYVDTRWLLPDYVPTPLVKYVRLTHYVDANIFHGQITTSYATGIPHLLNKNPVGWYSKKQINLEKATYGSEFVSTHTCVDHIIYKYFSNAFIGCYLYAILLIASESYVVQMLILLFRVL